MLSACAFRHYLMSMSLIVSCIFLLQGTLRTPGQSQGSDGQSYRLYQRSAAGANGEEVFPCASSGTFINDESIS